MLTLKELEEQIGLTIINKKQTTPRKNALRNSGAHVIATAGIDDGSILEVYDNAFILYDTELHYTVIPFRDVLTDYCYQTVSPDNSDWKEIPLYKFYEMPWVFRVLIEAEDRIVHNMYTSQTIEGCASLTDMMEQMLSAKDPDPDILELIVQKELRTALKDSEKALTEYQSYLVNEIYRNNRKAREIAEELKKTRQAIEDTVRRGVANMRKVFMEMGYDIDLSTAKNK